MEYEVVRKLKECEKSTVELVREKTDADRTASSLRIRKILRGRHFVYSVLQNCPHPYLPRIYEVTIEEDSVTVVEEYIEGGSLGSMELTDRQMLSAVKELCVVLGFLHEKNIIHRDIKPSNIMMAKDGHIRLIDFDAARVPKDDLEQDTRLLGTRGYAPPEQYGFAQTDKRTDIYALGVTLQQLMGPLADKPHYKRVIQKCTRFDPDKRYASAKQVSAALFGVKRRILSVSVPVILLCAVLCAVFIGKASGSRESLTPLPAPGNPHWGGESGIGLWENVPESGTNGQVHYRYRLYQSGDGQTPDIEKDTYFYESDMGGNFGINAETSLYETSFISAIRENGCYYFAVSAIGDGITYADSPYAVSDIFVYTGESAPPLPAPADLKWIIRSEAGGNSYYAAWSNMDDYADEDSFNVFFYDEAGNVVGNNIWSGKNVRQIGGVWFDVQGLGIPDGSYRFAVEVYSSRPNEYSSCYVPGPVPEEAFSPWLELSAGSRPKE